MANWREDRMIEYLCLWKESCTMWLITLKRGGTLTKLIKGEN